jgi:minimal PKS acyl carrier protein
LPAQEFSISDLMDLLVTRSGLPVANRTDDPGLTFADVGLDSLAFLQLQTVLEFQYGFDLSDVPNGTPSCTFGEIITFVNDRLAQKDSA